MFSTACKTLKEPGSLPGLIIIYLAIVISAVLPLKAGDSTAAMVSPQNFDRELPIDRGAAGLSQTLKRLQTRASMLMITVHPDDEDGGFLTYQSRGRGTHHASQPDPRRGRSQRHVQ